MGLELQVIEYRAIWTTLKIPDKDGKSVSALMTLRLGWQGPLLWEGGGLKGRMGSPLTSVEASMTSEDGQRHYGGA